MNGNHGGSRWYGTFEVPINGVGTWQIGPYDLWVQRSECEWRLASLQGRDSLDRTLRVDVPSDTTDPPEGAQIKRIAFETSPESVTLGPALADRPVVVSPEDPLQVPTDEKVILYISTPVWVELTTESGRVVLIDEPTHRPSDTWFGPSPMRGELCYATRTAARMVLENIPPRPHRVISVVEIKNRAKDSLTVDRLKIPTPHLSVYVTPEGGLWTETLTFDHHGDGEMAAVMLSSAPPANASGATLARGPRVPMETGLLTRTFGGLLG